MRAVGYAGWYYVHCTYIVDDVFYIVPALDTDLGAIESIDNFNNSYLYLGWKSVVIECMWSGNKWVILNK